MRRRTVFRLPSSAKEVRAHEDFARGKCDKKAVKNYLRRIVQWIVCHLRRDRNAGKKKKERGPLKKEALSLNQACDWVQWNLRNKGRKRAH